MKRLTLIFVALCACSASDIDKPSLGWLWDSSSKSIRRLAGLPGSLRNEAASQLPEDTLAAWASRDAMQVIVALPGDRLERRSGNSTDAEKISELKPDEVLFSPDGRHSALWWKSTNRFAKWGEAPQELYAKSIQLLNDGDSILLENDGLLKTSQGAWIGNFGPEAVFAVAGSKLVIAVARAFIIFEHNGRQWQQSSRHEYENITAFRQIEIESSDSLLAVGTEGQLTRWVPSLGVFESILTAGVERLRPLRQPGFYLAEGESPQLFFALGNSQKVYAIPAPEVRQ